MKENKIEKLILDLSNRWDCSPQEAVDRLNSMNESEINKLINSMTKKFQWGGLVKPPIQPRFVAPAHLNPSRSDVRMQQSAPSVSSSGVLTDMMEKERKNEAQKLMESASDLRSKQYADFLKQQEINRSTHSNQNMNRIMKNGGFIDCLRDGGSIEKCKCGCGSKINKAADGSRLSKKMEPWISNYQLPDKDMRITEIPATLHTPSQIDTVITTKDQRLVSPYSDPNRRPEGATVLSPRTWERKVKEFEDVTPTYDDGGQMKGGDKTPVVKNQEPASKMELPRYAKIVEQGWNAPRYTFLSDVNGGDLSTVTPNNINTYDGMMYAIEQVANPWAQYVNQMNRNAGLPIEERMYREPEFKLMIQQDDRGDNIPIEYSMGFVNPKFDNKKATKELSDKQATIRTSKKACGGNLPRKSKFKK